MDFDEKKKRQMVRVIIAEAGMVLSVVAIVIVAVLAAMGFMISGNGEIEQSGLMQLHTVPTGATVQIDGSTLFSRTNLSRTLTAGTHSLELSRDGYDTWQKDINIYAGVLMRLYYPRLFLQNREIEVTKTLSEESELEFYAPSQGRSYILYAEKGSAEWQLLDIRSDEIKITPLDLSGVLPGMVEVSQSKTKTVTQTIETHSYQFEGKIDEVIWSENEEKVLVKVTYKDKSEWVLVNLRNIAESLNITRTFGLDDVQIEMIDNSASQLYILDKQQLKRINTADRVMSRVLLDHVLSFSSYGSSVIYITENSEKEQLIGVYRDDEKGGTIIKEVPEGAKVAVALSNYYDEDYLVYSLNDEINVLYGKIPNYSEDDVKTTELKELVIEQKLMYVPEKLSVSADGEFVVAQKGTEYMVLDLDMGDLYEYEAPSAELKWFDSGMMYAISGGEILVWDFDNTNRRNLAESAQKAEDETLEMLGDVIAITPNNRWMYYLSKDSKNAVVLVREQIRD